ncbi:cytochrome c3 family protein [Desulfonatronospira sp. MSAO_Bac3]|uniref:cytochrome c3 family protein n=1 Tax=Desulfonatronospira sp. MSAO_Bac3 TaxID=2293857 RepID=UPI000FF2BFA6|nr:cytochrome c3 family protein [Desulfonatronospira sp. MSAO_Bac3]RQD79165.1 MAG: cytochrome C [Desulfonatronospira sp. MSAO_Bac3]
MRKSVVIGTVVAFFFGFLVLPSIYAGLTTQHEEKDQDMEYEFGSYADEWMLYAPEEYVEEEGEMEYDPVPFSHTVHGDYDCGECHHDEQGEPLDETNEITGCMSEGCHDMAVAEDADDERDIRYFEKAYHDQCMDCHRDMTREGEETGPVACNDCHTGGE